MDKKLWIVVQTSDADASDADASDVGVLGVYDNREAAYECMKVNDYCRLIGLHHYPVQSTFDPDYDSEYEDPNDYIGMGWLDSSGRP